MHKRNKYFWRGRTVLVTGGAGFIGSWLSLELLSCGARVVILDIKKQLPILGGARDAVLKKAVFVRGDVRDGKLLRALLTRYSFHTVFHLAAEAIVGDVLLSPAKGLDTNIRGTIEVLEAARTAPQKKRVQVIVASSDKAYGSHKKLPYKEDFGLLGSGHPYDCSKGCADSIARMYAHVYAVPISVLRCGNVYGGGDMNFSRLIPDAIRSFRKERQIELRSDGSYKRDFIYVKDIVNAYLSVAEIFAKKDIIGEAFNFGNDKPFSVLEVINALTGLMKKRHLTPVILGTARNEIRDQYLDSRKARRILGWRPSYTLLKGLGETIPWYEEYLSRYEK